MKIAHLRRIKVADTDPGNLFNSGPDLDFSSVSYPDSVLFLYEGSDPVPDHLNPDTPPLLPPGPVLMLRHKSHGIGIFNRNDFRCQENIRGIRIKVKCIPLYGFTSRERECEYREGRNQSFGNKFLLVRYHPPPPLSGRDNKKVVRKTKNRDKLTN